jgi:hypothetical protein
MGARRIGLFRRRRERDADLQQRDQSNIREPAYAPVDSIAAPGGVAAGSSTAANPSPGVPAASLDVARAQQGDDGLAKKVPAGPRWTAMRNIRHRRWRRFIYGVEPEPVPSFLGPVEAPEPGKLGICCSGGGIRSAAFNLGALQWLQEEKQLQKASYLAAVSGGSYIAAAISMVARTWPQRLRERPKADEEGYDDSNPACFDTLRPFAKGSPEEQYLRNRSSYMAPDTSALVYVVFRALLGLAFNLVFVSLPLFAAGLLLGEIVYRPHLHNLLGKCAQHHGGCKAEVHWWWTLPTGALALAMVLALIGMLRRTHDDSGRLLVTWSTRLLGLAVVLALLLVATPALIELFRHHVKVSTSSSGAPSGAGIIGGSAGVAGLVLGVVSQLRQALVTPKKAYEDVKKTSKWLQSLSSKARLAIAYVAGGLIGPVLLGAVYVFGVSVALANSPHGVRPWTLVVAGGALASFAVLYSIADLTSWSLHPFYKRRLCTAFALKRILPEDLNDDERAKERVERLDDEALAVERDYDQLVRLSQMDVPDWPTLLVCAAANISDTSATPPGRKVTSFTFSPYTVGGPLVGALSTKAMEAAFEDPKHGEGLYERARRFLRLPPQRRRLSDLSLPAAVAMSGAAISPSMGKMTKRPFTFLLALANIRLGVWVPNPRWVDRPRPDRRWLRWIADRLRRSDTRRDGTSPERVLAFGRPRPLYLFKEMLGLNRIGARYLYVTDGGHYENLGLVELLRRGCRQIYCFDASGGEGYETLGDAIALARSELDVEIGEMELKPLIPDQQTGQAAQMATHVDFRYPSDPLGTKPCRIVYAHNVLTGDSPWDAQAYHKRNPSFPHNSTLDQLYTDQKFEGYRVLGERAGEAAVKLMKAP